MLELIVNIGFLVITIAFMGVYLFSLILNLIRAIKTNKSLKEDPKHVMGVVSEIIKTKKRVYVKVDFSSSYSRTKFNTVFELTEKEFNDQYYEGQEVKIIYPNIVDDKKIHCFPIYLEGRKIQIEAGPVFTDALVFLAGVFIFSFSLYNMIISNAFKGSVPLVSMEANVPCVFNIFTFFIFVMIYLVVLGLIIERIAGISEVHSYNYLKVYGLVAQAEVVTYKLTKTKNERNVRRAQVKIRYSTNLGEQIETELYSFFYTENPEQYITILYDPRRPKMAVYLRG